MCVCVDPMCVVCGERHVCEAFVCGERVYMSVDTVPRVVCVCVWGGCVCKTSI